MKERIQLSDHFSYGRLVRFTLPTIGMMLIVSIYSVVDGLFVSNVVGTTPFAALNLIWPVIGIFSTIGYMFGTGGSALTAKTLGEGDGKKANDIFSFIFAVSIVVSIAVCTAGFIFTPQFASVLGAEGELKHQAVIYGRILFAAEPFMVLQIYFLSFFVTAEKPKYSLYVNILAGLTNIVLDALFIVVFRWGIAGAALATGLSQVVGSVVPLVYFIRKNDSLLQLCFPIQYDGKVLKKTVTNGASEMISNLSASLVAVVYNFQVMQLAGEAGVSAYGIINYVAYIFMTVFFGYALGSSSVVSFHFGARNKNELQSLFKKSLVIMTVSGVMMMALAWMTAPFFAAVFVRSEAEIVEMTVHGMHFYVFGFIPMGINVWASAFFTALNDGKVSAFLSFMRTLVFAIAFVLILPLIFGMDGIWAAFACGEFAALILSVSAFMLFRKKYGYL